MNNKTNMKYALVTGSSRGIGRAACIKLAQMGYSPIINYTGNYAAARETQELVRQAGQDGEILMFDVSNEEQTRKAIENWQAAHPDEYIEVLVNNAGIRRDNILALMPAEDWDKVLEIALGGFYNVTQPLLQPMMLAKTADSYVVLSRSASAPTKFRAASMTTDGLILRPTTYSAEVLAPAFKKFVGVANVYKNGKSAQGGDADCLDALKAVNNASSDLCKVQDGEWNKAQLKGAKAGYVYEIVYTAADFSGKIVVKRFYIELV